MPPLTAALCHGHHDLACDLLNELAGKELPMKKWNPKKARAGELNGNLEKDPDDWVTGEEPMTAAQASYLKTLCEEAGEAFTANLTKAQASKRIDELRKHPGHAWRPTG
jgi:hypothetical protein